MPSITIKSPCPKPRTPPRFSKTKSLTFEGVDGPDITAPKVCVGVGGPNTAGQRHNDAPDTLLPFQPHIIGCQDLRYRVQGQSALRQYPELFSFCSAVFRPLALYIGMTCLGILPPGAGTDLRWQSRCGRDDLGFVFPCPRAQCSWPSGQMPTFKELWSGWPQRPVPDQRRKDGDQDSRA